VTEEMHKNIKIDFRETDCDDASKSEFSVPEQKE
jgi:hypothetical protein